MKLINYVYNFIYIFGPVVEQIKLILSLYLSIDPEKRVFTNLFVYFFVSFLCFFFIQKKGVQ